MMKAEGKIRETPITELREHPDNPRQGNEEEIRASIEANGFYGVLVAQKSTGRVLAGNHRLKALKELGYETANVMWLDVDDDRARRILLGDNRTSDLALYDDKQLMNLLEELSDTGEGLKGTGYDEDDLSQLLTVFSDMDFLDGGGSQETAITRRRDESIPQDKLLPVSFSMTPEQRDDVLAAIAKAKEQGDVDSSEALAIVCREYLHA